MKTLSCKPWIWIGWIGVLFLSMQVGAGFLSGFRYAF